MTEADFLPVLALFLVVLASSAWRWRFLRRERLKTDRYALFAVRDRIVRLVAERHVSEDDESFRFLYEEINFIIPRSEPLTLRNVVRAIRDSRLLSDEAFRERWRAAARHQDSHVRDAARDFIYAILGILIGRSLFVKVSAHVTQSGMVVVSAVRNLISRVLRVEDEAYRRHRARRGSVRPPSRLRWVGGEAYQMHRDLADLADLAHVDSSG